MHCPLTGKPCVMPKEVFVTEVKPEGIRHIYMCRICGDEYIKNLTDADVVTKSLEVVSSNGNVSHSEHILQDGQPSGDILEQILRTDEELPPSDFSPEKQKMNRVKALEARLDEAVIEEDYELAAKLRDELKELD